MFKINDYVVYRKSVCKVGKIKEIEGKKYYELLPMEDSSLVINIPTTIDSTLIREVISKEKIESIINSIPSIEEISCVNDKIMEQNYRDLLNDGSYDSLIRIIKTTFLRNKLRAENNRKVGEKDLAYLKKAEKLLYNEFSIALGMSYDETKKYVSDRVSSLLEK